MSKVKTITATTTEQEITLDATYQFVWFRNLGDNDCYVSDHSGIVAGADDVALCKAGECVRITLPQAPMSNKAYIKAVDGSNTVEIHAQNFSDKPTAKTGKGSGGGQSITVEPLSVTANGTYTAPTGKAYSPVTVDVQEQPWQPLQDGYSNFWFELTNDTLSPWLNFSAKNNDAVIDWGDGSGEVALTTLTPTHTYSKAGRYVVKVKGVTEIARQHSTAFSALTPYVYSCKAIELSNEITNISETYAFCNMFGLEHFYASASFSNIGRDLFAKDFNLKDAVIHFSDVLPLTCFNAASSLLTIDVGNSFTVMGNNSVYYCYSLKEFTIPSGVTSIGDSAFSSDAMLKTIHCQPTTPPTLGTNVFLNLPSDYIIYVPVGTSETYKAASGWSSYAGHILEEGQTPNRAMLAKFNSAKTDEPQDDMR